MISPRTEKDILLVLILTLICMNNSIEFSNLEKIEYIINLRAITELVLLLSAPSEDVDYRSESMSLLACIF